MEESSHASGACYVFWWPKTPNHHVTNSNKWRHFYQVVTCIMILDELVVLGFCLPPLFSFYGIEV
jgi:hypothetical protein